ncbi:murein transglycosylase A [Neisseria sp. Ec49-e6-T10]|uniref:murein transglycosylase A n=1 Tax=Neisseria sp. Ec49-e6-T10 TaxID=3140744 RepID=UPI003EB9C495
MKKLALSVCCLLVLSACGVTKKTNTGGVGQTHQNDQISYHSASFSELPDWQTQNFQASLSSFLQGCIKLQNNPSWINVCQQAQRLGNENAQIKKFFENNFQPWQIRDNGKIEGMVTGYYEPIVKGGLSQSDSARYPIYGIPNDFFVVDYPASLRGKAQLIVKPIANNRMQVLDKSTAGVGEYTVRTSEFLIDDRTKALKGRIDGNRFVPYYTRAQINQGILNGKAPILGYANDPIELFFLQVQGSGRLQTRDGQFVRLGYAEQNGFAYTSIGKYLVDKGELTLGQASMQGIKAWIQLNPHRLDEVLGVNQSFVFFRVLPNATGGPIGALGVPLTDGYSGAVDPRYVTLGSPLFLSTTYPSSNQPLNRLIMAQDTGGAIRGGVRVDFFWGFGDEAGATAGKMKQNGRVWTLLPKGITPTTKK